MSFKVPDSNDYPQTSSPGTLASEDFHLTSEYLPNNNAIMSDLDIIGDQSPPSSLLNLTTEDINKVLRILAALKNAPPEAQNYIQNLVDGKQPEVPSSHSGTQKEENLQSPAKISSMSSGVMKMDAKFDKWDGNSLSWTPHYYFLKAQCRVYQPLLVTEEAVCLKIYESIPEPQRQRIRGYWIRCGEQESYNWKEMLDTCHKEYFDEIEAQKAERKLLSMRQGESQIFKRFLQEWELQLEFAGGREWPDSIKINHIRTAVSDKIREKFAVLSLLRDNYQAWVERITEVAAIMEDSENFIQKGEAQTTRYASRNGELKSEYLTNTANSNSSKIPVSGTIDHDGDTVMGGMKLDLNSLATLISKISEKESENSKKREKEKIAAPWRSEKEVSELREKNLCLICKQGGHIARYCKTFGPARRSGLINNMESMKLFEDDNSNYVTGNA